MTSDATVVLPVTEYGFTKSGPTGPPGHKTSTDPVSGTTYVFDANYSIMLSGHFRDGAPLPGTALGAKFIEAIGLGTFPAQLPGLAATEDGAWVAWRQDDGPNGSETIVQRLDANGDPTGSAFSLPKAPDPELGYWGTALLPLGGSSVRIFAASRYRIYAFDYDGSALSEPSVVLDGPTEIDGLYWLDARELIALSSGGETWLGFQENGEILRAVKIAPGCVYPRKVHVGPEPEWHQH